MAALSAVVPATAQAEDLVVNSFDGTPIVAHWFPNPSLAAGQRAPVVLNGPGWSSPGENEPCAGAPSSDCTTWATTCSPGTRAASASRAAR